MTSTTWSGWGCRADGVEPDRHRLGERRMLGGEVPWDLQQARFGQDHELAVAARQVVAVADRGHLAAEHADRHRGHAGSDREPARRPGRSPDLAAELVTHDDVAVEDGGEHRLRPARGEELGRVAEKVKVGATDAAGERPHQRLSFAWRRLGHVVEDDRAIAHDGGLHGQVLQRSPARSCHRDRAGPRHSHVPASEPHPPSLSSPSLEKRPTTQTDPVEATRTDSHRRKRPH